MDSYIQGVRIHKFKRIILTARKVQLAQHWARSLGMNKAWPRSLDGKHVPQYHCSHLHSRLPSQRHCRFNITP